MKYLVYVSRVYEAYVAVEADSLVGARNLVKGKAHKIEREVLPCTDVSVMGEVKPEEGNDCPDLDVIEYEDLP